jgi:EAL domain-containing protein (putative c-di-GMP-specific phosphodiesterase class I)
LEAHPQHVAGLDKVAINLSGLSLGDEQLLGHILQRFAGSQVPPAKICFEITETAAVTNMASAGRFIQALKQIGCRFALDDFGAGMSSFTYLKNMPVDYVKIDGSFVRNMALDATDYAMVKAIAEIAVSLGKETIAEFVSDQQVSQLLTELGVGFGQGFALHKPEPWLPLLKHPELTQQELTQANTTSEKVAAQA